MITPETKNIILIGKPIGHSPSADMHNAAYKAMGLDIQYLKCEIDKDALKNEIRALRDDLYIGCAVTMPYKIDVIGYLDDLDPLCSRIGAVNTVVKNKDNKLIGYNTDGLGALECLKSRISSLQDKAVLIYGAGGCGRSVSMALADYGIKHIYIINRTDHKAKNLSENINKYYLNKCSYIPYNDIMAQERAIEASDIIMNLSGLGMNGLEGKSPVDSHFIKSKHICFDATYEPDETKFLHDARNAGCTNLINGKEMLLNQAVMQIKLWTGSDAPIEIMKSVLYA